MSFGQFLAVLRARWKAALITLVLTVGLTVAVSLLLPSQYTATASIVVDFKPDPVTAMMYPGTAPGVMATQVDVIQSERVAYRVVRNLRLTENAQIRQQWQDETQGKGSMETWLAQTFQKRMDVNPSRDSSVITISYKAPDPQFAAALANAFVQAYLETSVELRVDPARQYSSFFDTRSKDAREALERAQTRLSAFQKDKGIIASDERLDVENSRLNDLSSQLVMLQALSSESGSRQAQARGSSADRIQEVLNNPLISGLKSDLSRAEANLQQLSSRFGDSHPQIVEAKANIAALRSKVDAETLRVTGGVGVSNTINRQREADVRASLEEQRAKVLRLKAVRDEGSVLQRDVESAQRAFEMVTARFTQTTLESQATQSNINLLTPAAPPLEPSSPLILLNTTASVFLGLLFAVGLILALEALDRRVRTVQDISTGLGLPVIAALPKPNSGNRSGNARAALMQQKVVGRLSAPAKGA
jgi:chain length determinant protein EpsF